MSERWWNIGPPQVWQTSMRQWTGDVPPLQRLYRAAHRGLIVGKLCQTAGGLSTPVARRLEAHGDVTLVRNEDGVIVWAYACQLAFNFEE